MASIYKRGRVRYLYFRVNGRRVREADRQVQEGG